MKELGLDSRNLMSTFLTHPYAYPAGPSLDVPDEGCPPPPPTPVSPVKHLQVCKSRARARALNDQRRPPFYNLGHEFQFSLKNKFYRVNSNEGAVEEDRGSTATTPV